MGINEQIKRAATVADIRRLAATEQQMASRKTLRKRTRLCKQCLSQLEKEVAPAKKTR